MAALVSFIQHLHMSHQCMAWLFQYCGQPAKHKGKGAQRSAGEIDLHAQVSVGRSPCTVSPQQQRLGPVSASNHALPRIAVTVEAVLRTSVMIADGWGV